MASGCWPVGAQARFRFPDSPNSVPGPEEAVRRLESIDWSFAELPTDDLTHGLHPYPARFPPALPAALISQLSLPGDLVWDPFGGGGTTAVEALVQRRRCLSSDANPLAAIIGQAKTVTLTSDVEHELAGLANACLSVSQAGTAGQLVEESNGRLDSYVPHIPNHEKWFAHNVTQELAYLRWRIDALNDEGSRSVALCCLSSIIVRVSFQDSETRYASHPRDIPDGFVLHSFGKELLRALRRLKLAQPFLGMRTCEFVTSDARTATITEQNSVDLIVTSPPYPNATDYHLYHRFRLYWLGFHPQELARVEIGSHLRHQRERSGPDRYLLEMRACLDRFLQALRPGRYAALVVGSGFFAGSLFDAAGAIEREAIEAGFEPVCRIKRPLPRHQRSFQPGARRAEEESLIVLRKPDRVLTVSLVPTAYTRWPYEEVLRQREAEALVGSAGGDLSGDGLTARILGSKLPALRRLTFTRAVEGEGWAYMPTWQSILENGEGVSKRKDPKYATHGLHPFKGKFYPQLVRSLINLASVPLGGVVLDPFAGSGTTLLEAFLNGFRARGSDLSPLAAELADVKIRVLTVDPSWLKFCVSEHMRDLARSTGSAVQTPWSPDVEREIRSWFPDPVVDKLARVLDAIRRVPDLTVQRFLKLVLSSLLRSCSQQEPTDLRVRRRREPLVDAPLLEDYVTAVQEQTGRVLDFAHRLGYCPNPVYPAEVWQGDARDVAAFHANGVVDGSVDLVITSPPYATALPYIDTDRLSYMVLWNMGATARRQLEESLTGSREIGGRSRKQIEALIEGQGLERIQSHTARELVCQIHELNQRHDVGFRRKNMAALLYRYFEGMAEALGAMDRVLKPGGQAMIVIGDNRTIAGTTEVRITTTRIIEELAVALGWTLRESIPITVTKEALLHSRNSIVENRVLWFAKP